MHLKKNIPDTYKNVGNSTGRLLFTILPAGFENFFAEVGGVTPFFIYIHIELAIITKIQKRRAVPNNEKLDKLLELRR